MDTKVNLDLLIGQTMEKITFVNNLFKIAMACNTDSEPENGKELVANGFGIIINELLAANAARATIYDNPNIAENYYGFIELLSREAKKIKI